VSGTIYLEGGGDSKELHTRCREGFRKLFERCGFQGRMPRLVACGGRGAAFDDFKIAHGKKSGSDLVAMLIDSEDPPDSPLSPWQHLKNRDGWDRPSRAYAYQVLFMVTCMETWILADRATLAEHYGSKLQTSALPPLTGLESMLRHDFHEKLMHSTRKCSNAFQKGRRSFEVLAKLAPGILRKHLSSFARMYVVLDEHL
jgi:hypothetical protein